MRAFGFGPGIRGRSAPRGAGAPPVAPVDAIDAGGWSAMWRGTPPALSPETAPQGVTVRRAGFDASGAPTMHVERRIATCRRRRAYPDQRQPDDDRVALDDYVYATDAIPGVANASAEISPKPVAAWVMPDRLLVGNSVRWEMVAFHRDYRAGRQVAAVRVRGNDGTTQTAWQVVGATTISTLCEDANPIEVYGGDLDVSALATGVFWLEAEVFPWIGDAAAILRSEDVHAAGGGRREFTRRNFLKDVACAANPPLAYVAAGGSDGTGVVAPDPAGASAYPFATVNGAIAGLVAATGITGGRVDGCRIRIVDTVPMTGSRTATPQTCAALVIERAPGTARDAAVCTLSATWAPNIGTSGLAAGLSEGALVFRDVTVRRTASGAILTGGSPANLAIAWWNARYDNGGFAGVSNRVHMAMYGAGVVNPGSSLAYSAANEVRLVRGLTADMANNGIEPWVWIGCALTRLNGGVHRDPRKGAIWYANRILNPAAGNAPIGIAAATAGDVITGIVVVQNLIETTHTTVSTPALRISSDGANGDTVHTIVAHNTFTGYGNVGRHNLFYDESSGTNRRSHRLMRHAGDLASQINTKGDLFHSTADAAEAANRTGNLAYVHGVGCRGNWSQFVDANGGGAGTLGAGPTFGQLYAGNGSRIGGSLTAQQAAAGAIWADYRGTAGSGGMPSAGTGGGDYILMANAPVPSLAGTGGLAFDLAGRPRGGGGSAAGAYAL